MTRRQRQAKHAAEHRHMTNRLIGLYVAASADTIFEGRAWYPHAEGVIAELSKRYGIGRPAVAGVVAALSPQTRWRSNIDAAESVLAGDIDAARRHCYRANIDKAQAIALQLGDPLDVLGGPKVRAFWANLVGSREAVTVDVWATRAATAGRLSAPTNASYPRIARAYATAAEIVGESPRDLQAAIWLHVRPGAEHARDKLTIQAKGVPA